MREKVDVAMILFHFVNRPKVIKGAGKSRENFELLAILA